MNATLAPGASLRRVAEIVRNAVLFGPDAWEGGSLPDKNVNPTQRPNILPNDRDVVELFTLLCERQTPYLLVGGIAMLRYVEGRNTEDIHLLMSLPSLKQLPEISVEGTERVFHSGPLSQCAGGRVAHRQHPSRTHSNPSAPPTALRNWKCRRLRRRGWSCLSFYALPSLSPAGLVRPCDGL